MSTETLRLDGFDWELMRDRTWGDLPVKRCIECHNLWPLIYFHHNPTGQRRVICTRSYDCDDPGHHQSRCIGCKQSEHHARSVRERARDKVQKTLRIHATQDGYPNRAAFLHATGLSEGEILDALLMALDVGCPRCHVVFDRLDEFHFDRRDPRLPITRSNWRWLCGTCNKEHASAPPEIDDMRTRCWELYVAKKARP